jgi:hypothetical protein
VSGKACPLGEALPSTVSAEDKPSLFDRFTMPDRFMKER